MMPGAVKSSQALRAAYGDALNRLEAISAADVSVIRQYVAELNEEAGQWRRRYRQLQAETIDAERGSA